MASEDAKVQDVLNCLRRHRMTLVTFIETFFAVNDILHQLQEAGFLRMWVEEQEESIERWNNGVREMDSMAFGSGDEMDIN